MLLTGIDPEAEFPTGHRSREEQRRLLLDLDPLVTLTPLYAQPAAATSNQSRIRSSTLQSVRYVD